ncbi:MAG: DUF559 domain-containing protein [Rhodanobacter sp.]|nr:MAG: DUF559 domain-containing protein [Rhodanobacter sp.]TAM13674.1 MAG: DUF559 domain-containing protein [Rhodanobacter sp.]TAM35850.1 MAG: DUF559 domain-containing protein [Rhodanobacter sp.]
MRGQISLFTLGPTLRHLLRHGATDAERFLWGYLRGRRMDGCEFHRRHPFADYILDFVCLERRVVVELDAGQAAADAVRTLFLEGAGFRVLRFGHHEVFTDSAAVREVIRAALQASKPTSSLAGKGREGQTRRGAESIDFPPADGEIGGRR